MCTAYMQALRDIRLKSISLELNLAPRWVPVPCVFGLLFMSSCTLRSDLYLHV